MDIFTEFPVEFDCQLQITHIFAGGEFELVEKSLSFGWLVPFEICSEKIGGGLAKNYWLIAMAFACDAERRPTFIPLRAKAIVPNVVPKPRSEKRTM